VEPLKEAKINDPLMEHLILNGACAF